MRLHVEALFTCDDRGRLLAVNQPGGTVAPRFFLGRTAIGNLWWFRHDLDDGLTDELGSLCESQPPGLDPGNDPVGSALAACLSRVEPVRNTWAGPAFHVPSGGVGSQTAVRVTQANASVLSPLFEDWRPDVEAGVPMAAILKNRQAVSVCCSVRLTQRAHEAGVETHPEYRGRGYAGQAVCAWAQVVRELDRVPLYSTSWDNTASRAVAKALGLIQFGVDVHLT